MMMRLPHLSLPCAALTLLMLLSTSAWAEEEVQYLATYSNASAARGANWKQPFVTVLLWRQGNEYLGVLRFSAADKTSSCALLRDISFMATTGDLSFGFSMLVPKFDNERHRFDFFSVLDGDTLRGRLSESQITVRQFRDFDWRDLVLVKSEVDESLTRSYQTRALWQYAQEHRMQNCDYDIIDNDVVVSQRKLHPFEDRLEVSVWAGGGFPVAEFSDPQRGNHEGGGFNHGFAAELYLQPRYALGIGVWMSDFDDRTVGSLLSTKVRVVGPVFKYMIAAEGHVLPFIQVGAGLANLKFNDSGSTFGVDEAFGMMLGLGVQWRLSGVFAVNARLSYLHAFSDGADIRIIGTNAELDFDTQFYSLEAGVSVFSF
jgi:opacity protein-like surface antigen